MGGIFISHVEEDADLAIRIVDGLHAAGYSTWCYEQDAVPGPSYLLQTARQVEAAQAVVLLISPDSLGSHQVTAEVIRAHESGRPFIPVLVGISHVEFAARQPEWREALGSATSIALPDGDVGRILPRIVNGLRSLGITPEGGPGSGDLGTGALPPLIATAPPLPPPAPPGTRRPAGGRLPLLIGAAVVVVLVALVIAVVTWGSGGGRDDLAAPDATGQAAPGADDQAGEPTTAPDPEDLAAATDVPLTTPLGELTLLGADLTQEACPPYSSDPADCLPLPTGSDRYLVLRITAGDAAILGLTDDFIDEFHESWTSYGYDGRADPYSVSLDSEDEEIQLVYAVMPATAGESPIVWSWPENDPLRLTVS